MTLPDGQAPAGAHIPRLIPLRETVKLPPDATTLRAVRRASIGATLVTAKSGDKAANGSARRNHSPTVIEPGLTTHRAEAERTPW